MTKTKTLLIDADILVYETAFALEEAYEWEPDLWTVTADLGEAKRRVVQFIDDMLQQTGYNKAALALTDGENWRKDILPTYKGNRKQRKPIIFKALRQYLIDEHMAYIRPRLEGDDIIGILMTHPEIIPGDKMIYSIDKDFGTIPGKRWVKGVIHEATPAEADYFHMVQTLTGDTVDNYSGCPGVGPVTARKILDKAEGNYWPAVVKAFVKAGLTEADALVQARVARICRHTDYDFTTKKVIYWTPPAATAG